MPSSWYWLKVSIPLYIPKLNSNRSLTGGLEIDRNYDVIYYTLTIGILLALSYSVFISLKISHNPSASIIQRSAGGNNLIALGTAVALLGGLLTDIFLKHSAIFQQARFAFFYIGFALITVGFTSIMGESQKTYPLPKYLSDSRLSNFIVWLLFLGTLVISFFYLVNPKTFVINRYGYQVQLIVYSIPLLTTTFVGAVFLF